MKHWGSLTAWNKHEPWRCTVMRMVFQNTVSDQLRALVASSVGLQIISLKFKFHCQVLIWVFFLLIHICNCYHSSTMYFYSLALSLPSSIILHCSCSTFSKALISYHQCSWQVCRHRSLQSSWWGSCTGQWSAQRSLPPLQVWTHSWQQIPGNAG